VSPAAFRVITGPITFLPKRVRFLAERVPEWHSEWSERTPVACQWPVTKRIKTVADQNRLSRAVRLTGIRRGAAIGRMRFT